jgi:hypothetical protein
MTVVDSFMISNDVEVDGGLNPAYVLECRKRLSLGVRLSRFVILQAEASNQHRSRSV